MAKQKNCEFDAEIRNGAQTGIAAFVIGAGISIMKRIGKDMRRKRGNKKTEEKK